MSIQPFWEKGLRFSCQQCSACCRFDPGFVYLTEHDLTMLQIWASLTKELFVETFCRWVLMGDGYEYLCLKEKPNYDCILWDNGCTAYLYRPIQCSSYPFWDYLLSSQVLWNKNAKDCPGINCGKWYSKEEIAAFLAESERNPVIKRKKQR